MLQEILFRQLDLAEEADFRKYAQENDPPEMSKWWIYHPVCREEWEKRGLVAPSVRSDDSRVHAAQAGGHVLEPRSGLYRHVWVYDFRSLYPSIIIAHNIDPSTIVKGEGDYFEAPNGIKFRKDRIGTD